MRRSPALSALSRGHLAAFWSEHGRRHFEIEEALLLPALPADPAWAEAGRRMRAEHGAIREAVAQVTGAAAIDDAHTLGELLTAHVRWKERSAFPLLEAGLAPAELAALGESIDEAETR